MCYVPAYALEHRSYSNLPPKDVHEGSAWKRKYHSHCQLIFSSFQHHWHKKDSEGQRQPLPSCRLKKATVKSKKSCTCRMGFPKKTHPLIAAGPRVVCTGIAKLLDLPTDGRRDASGSIAPARSEEYCSGTSPALAAIMHCNSDVQCPYNVPLCRATHDPECKHCRKTSPAISAATFQSRSHSECMS